jgi:hypothetical protein
VLINHRKCSFSTEKGVEAEGMQPPKMFERAERKLVLSHEPDVKNRCNDEEYNRRKLALWEMMLIRGVHPKGSKHLRIIHCINHFKSTQSGY